MGVSEESTLSEIILEGSPFERGLQHGRCMSRAINDFLKDDWAQINRLRSKPLDNDRFSQYIQPYQEVIWLYLPDILQELKGLADGAGISLEEAVLLQIRRELVGTGGLTLTGDCSSFGWHTPNQVVVGQTIDLNGNMTCLGQVFRIKPSKPETPEILMYSFAGLLGYMGMNSFGLAVAINLVISDGWRVGIPPYLLVRKFLECRNIDECLAITETMPRASSRSFIIADEYKQIILELTQSDYRVIEDNFLVHTNHYLHTDFKQVDRMNIFSRNSSVKRLNWLQKNLECNPLDVEVIKSIFADHSPYPVGICAHNGSNEKMTETVAAVIMYPRKGSFWALKGKPCKGSYQKFSFKQN